MKIESEWQLPFPYIYLTPRSLRNRPSCSWIPTFIHTHSLTDSYEMTNSFKKKPVKRNLLLKSSRCVFPFVPFKSFNPYFIQSKSKRKYFRASFSSTNHIGSVFVLALTYKSSSYASKIYGTTPWIFIL